MKIWPLKSPEKSGLLIVGAIETIKHETKKRRYIFWGYYDVFECFINSINTFSLVQPLSSSLINATTEKRVMIAEKGQEGRYFPSLALSLMIRAMSGRGVTKRGRLYNNMDHMDKNL